MGSRPVCAFRQSQSGNVAIIFAFALLPLMLAAGIAIDFARLSDTKTKLDVALDSSMLWAAEQAKAAGTNFNASSIQTQAQSYFNAAMGALPGVTVISFSVVVAQSGAGGLTSTATGTYAAQINTTFGLAGFTALNLNGQSTATAASPGFYQIVFLIDTSGSMGIGGTASDITALENQFGCAFACHDPNNYDGDGNSRLRAQQAGIKLKFDYAKSALQTFVSTLQPMLTAYPNNYLVGVNTFGTNFSQVLAPTSNISAINAAISPLDIDVVDPNNNWGFTNTTAALNSTASKLTNIGDGSTASSVLTYVIFITDGMEDTLPACSIWGRCTDLSYGSGCSALKNRNVNVFTILAPYPTITNDVQYDTIVAPYQSQLAPTMQSCASSASMAFVATDGPSIVAAVNQVFSAISAATRISN